MRGARLLLLPLACAAAWAVAAPLERGRTYALPRTVQVFPAHPLDVQAAPAAERARLSMPVGVASDFAARVAEVRTDRAGSWYRIEPVTSGTLEFVDAGGRAWVSGEQVDGLDLKPAPIVEPARKSAPRATASPTPVAPDASRAAAPRARAGVSGMAGRYGGAAAPRATPPTPQLPVPPGGGGAVVREMVYICTNGRLYHRTVDCPAIRTVEHCNGSVESVPLDKAQAKGKSSCRACHR